MEASRRRYRVQMMEAAVVGEEAELHVQAQRKAWRLAWRRDPTEAYLTYSGAD